MEANRNELEHVKDDIKGHEKRIQKLELSDATTGERLKGLTKSLDELIWWLKVIIIGAVSTGVGFIVWYIQK